MTEWKWRIYLFIRASDNTFQNRQALASIYVNNGSGESLENEMKLFDFHSKFSVSGNLPAQAIGINLAAKTSMKDDFISLLSLLSNARYAVVSAITTPMYEENELAFTNVSGIVPNGQIVTWEMAKTFIENEFGLTEIPEGA